MNTRNTVILLVVLVALAGYVYFGELGGGKKTAEATPTPSPRTMWDFPAEKINRIEVQDLATKDRARLTKNESGDWQIEQPIQYPADQNRLRSLTGRLAKIVASRAITNTPADLAPFGLLTGTLDVQIGLTENQTHTLLVGDKNPQGFSYYVKADDDPTMYLVSSGLIDDLRRLITEPPRKPTPTPTFTATPVVTPTATITATAIVTPTP
jgi:hypothetical protein